MRHAWGLLALFAACACAQDAVRGNFRIDANVVLVKVTVTDPQGHFITGLTRENFQVFEDRAEQSVAYFSAEEVPVSVGLVLDFSRSMTARFGELKQAVGEFLKSANPRDEFCVVEFRGRAELSVGFTDTPEEIRNRLAFARPEGSTALLDAIYVGLRQMRRARNPRKILLIVSDGGDNHSRYRAREVESLARESDVEIYAIGIVDRFYSRTGWERFAGPELLDDITEMAGGRYYEIERARELPGVAESIGRELRHEYVLGYVPSNRRRDGRYRHIQVKIAHEPGQPRYSAYWRRGYFAPGE